MATYFGDIGAQKLIFFGAAAIAVGSVLYQRHTWFREEEKTPEEKLVIRVEQVQKRTLVVDKGASLEKHQEPLFREEEELVVRIKQVYKRRLFVGEGDFSYTQAVLEKHRETHPNLGQWITATDLKDFSKNSPEVKRKGIEMRMQWLQTQGVTVLLDVDSQEIHHRFEGERLKRIQWNCPFGSGTDQAVFRTVIPSFFQACSHLQQPGDRVHITLIQDEKDWVLRQKQNPIVLGSSSAGYRLIKKRLFDQNRYPAYQHVKTNGNKYPKQTDKREFVFEKTGLEGGSSLEKVQELMDPEKKRYEIQTDRQKKAASLKHYCFDCSTDEDSSSYEDHLV